MYHLGDMPSPTAALLAALSCPSCSGTGKGVTCSGHLGNPYAAERECVCSACDGSGARIACECCPRIRWADENPLLAYPESVVVIDGAVTCGPCTAEWVVREVVGLLAAGAAKEAA